MHDVGNPQPVRGQRPEVAQRQITGPFRGGIRDGGSSDDTAAGTHKAQHGHEPFDCQPAAEPPSRIRSVVAKRENDVNHQSEAFGDVEMGQTCIGARNAVAEALELLRTVRRSPDVEEGSIARKLDVSAGATHEEGLAVAARDCRVLTPCKTREFDYRPATSSHARSPVKRWSTFMVVLAFTHSMSASSPALA